MSSASLLNPQARGRRLGILISTFFMTNLLPIFAYFMNHRKADYYIVWLFYYLLLVFLSVPKTKGCAQFCSEFQCMSQIPSANCVTLPLFLYYLALLLKRWKNWLKKVLLDVFSDCTDFSARSPQLLDQSSDNNNDCAAINGACKWAVNVRLLFVVTYHDSFSLGRRLVCGNAVLGQHCRRLRADPIHTTAL